ncbi:MAG: histidine kinase N-terminal 7TM domain-containing protein [Candidatus Scatovivens sp.]
MLTSLNSIVILIITCLFINILLAYSLSTKKQTDIRKSFSYICLTMLIWLLGLIIQATFSSRLNVSPIYFDYFVYIGTCLSPVAFYNFSKTFSSTKYKLNKKLLIIPILSLLILWTNDFHHLFFKEYSININEGVVGNYFYIHTIYTYLLFCLAFINLIKYSVKNAGVFSKQAILFLLGSLFPIIANIFGTLGIIPISIYVTPICFAFTIIFYSFAIFKFDFLKVTPIALQRVVDRMSDSYVVVNEDNVITDFNKTFLDTFKLKSQNIRNKNISSFLNKADTTSITKKLDTVKRTNKQISFRKVFSSMNKIFTIEISSIIDKKNYLGTLILFKDITQHELDKKKIEENQDILVEKERLASLGQMIGGIAHNLKTPIFSVSGGIVALDDLIDEVDSTVGDPEITGEDIHDMAREMRDWTSKIQSYMSYMSDVITAVKGQAVAFSESQTDLFNVDEVFKRVDILMAHEFKHSLVKLVIKNNTPNSISIKGNINALVQVINNLLTNSLDAYNGEQLGDIELISEYKDRNVIISVKDHGPGLPETVKEKLFKEMITTKGKNGTGLGLFMSYSNIKAHFSGTMTFESEPGHGTTFNIIIPV